jgi:hypothetical protein
MWDGTDLKTPKYNTTLTLGQSMEEKKKAREGKGLPSTPLISSSKLLFNYWVHSPLS